jgi:hypothetical protein
MNRLKSSGLTLMDQDRGGSVPPNIDRNAFKNNKQTQHYGLGHTPNQAIVEPLGLGRSVEPEDLKIGLGHPIKPDKKPWLDLDNESAGPVGPVMLGNSSYEAPSAKDYSGIPETTAKTNLSKEAIAALQNYMDPNK